MEKIIKVGSSAKSIKALNAFLQNNPECIKSANKDEIVCTIDGFEFRITRSHSFYDGGKFTFLVASDGMMVFRHDYGMVRFPEQDVKDAVDQLFSIVDEVFDSYKTTRRMELQKWWAGRF